MGRGSPPVTARLVQDEEVLRVAALEDAEIVPVDMADV